jgi:DNA-binding beta-propeller fold protein YncE
LSFNRISFLSQRAHLTRYKFLTKFGETGSGDGQLSSPEGVGVDKESGVVYVANTGNSQIQLFEHQ